MALLREIEVKSRDLVDKIDIKIAGKEFDKPLITG
jgi:hypothetical protein